MNYDPHRDQQLLFAIAMSTGSVDEGLDAIEKMNHAQARNDSRVPRNMKPSREAFEALGFEFTEIDDNVLIKAKLPEGWTIQAIDGYWSEICDETGKRRATYFYKSAFYDRNGHMVLV